MDTNPNTRARGESAQGDSSGHLAKPLGSYAKYSQPQIYNNDQYPRKGEAEASQERADQQLADESDYNIQFYAQKRDKSYEL